MSWPLVALKDCCTVVGGATPKREVESYWDSQDIPWVTPKDISKIKSIYLDDAPEYISQKGFDSCAAHKLPEGSLLLTSRAPIGNVAITTRELCTNQGFKSLVPSESVDIKYLYFCMLYSAERLENEGNGATFKEVSKKVVEAFKIPLPPLETQKKIAAVLEKADQLRKDCKLLEQELNSLAQSVFIDMFGDVRSNSFNSKKVKFDDIFEINSKLVDPRLPEFENLPHIGPEHLEKRTGRILPYRTAREDALVSGKFNFQKGCVLFSKIRPNLKKVAIPEFSGLCSADMYPLEAVDGVSTREFIWGLILSDAFDDYLETLPSRANIPKINRKELAAFEFYLPDLRDQKAYSKKLAKIQEQLKQNACLYQETENNFNALMQKAFKGKLTL
ncbi:restriction endonuclease subunit S [Vibrio parahaemolyticus]|uniref:restriction endonuclease subunit S n=1 Tax=Vibrio parahaemolyticus TaxID=670 RepID=UPI001C9C9582|nr:restriction endonuclease subunit S [Vibrio parahaemolyticus]MBY7929377.1 restriction endonuclease subunit S [Vibrio fluvialis]MDG2596432.1 restriction endonuclease subunit S [Vibrio parahaemolyticus]